MQARGLKPFLKQQLNYRDYVAPHAGAWIETGMHSKISNQRNVAPHAGAWIETRN